MYTTSAVGDHYKINERSIRVRSVHVQTDAKIVPYPAGSVWPEPPPGRPQRNTQQDGESSSIGPQSVNTWWDATSHHSLASVDDDAYSTKTMSHIAAPRRDHRTKGHRSGLKNKKQQPQMQQLQSCSIDKHTSGGMMPAELLSSIEGKSALASWGHRAPADAPHVSASWSAGTPTIPSPDAYLSPYVGQKSPVIPPMAYRQSHSNFSARPGNFLHHLHQQSQPPHLLAGSLPSDISVSGQGFIMPTVLPKL